MRRRPIGGQFNFRKRLVSVATEQSQLRHETETQARPTVSSLGESPSLPSGSPVPLRLPKRRPALMLLTLLAAAIAFAVVRPADQASTLAPVVPGSEAVLVVDGIDYEFELDTCFVGDDSFVVAGHGKQGDEDFRVLASPSEVELAFGVVDEGAPVPEGGRWFGAQDNVTWTATQSIVTARLQMVERLGDSEIPHDARLRIDCGAVS